MYAYDAFKGEKCIITTDLNVIVADFNMQSYLCNHLGASATQDKRYAETAVKSDFSKLYKTSLYIEQMIKNK